MVIVVAIVLLIYLVVLLAFINYYELLIACCRRRSAARVAQKIFLFWWMVRKILLDLTLSASPRILIVQRIERCWSSAKLECVLLFGSTIHASLLSGVGSLQVTNSSIVYNSNKVSIPAVDNSDGVPNCFIPRNSSFANDDICIFVNIC